MPVYPAGTFSGNYQPSSPEALANADIVVGHEFAAPAEGCLEPGVINQAIARIVVERYAHLPIYAAESVARAIDDIDPDLPVHVFRDTTSNTLASKGGTRDELRHVWDQTGHRLVRSIHVAHAFHVGRVAEQARRIGFSPQIPEGLPSGFDPTSVQWWCRGRVRWQLREMPGVLALRLTGRY